MSLDVLKWHGSKVNCQGTFENHCSNAWMWCNIIQKFYAPQAFILCCYFLCFRVERSTDQVVKPVNLDGLNSWVGHIPMNVLSEADTIAPMLLKLGYDPYNYNPKYGEPDEIVKANLKLLEKNPESFQVETFRIDRDGSIQKGQPGQNEMAALAAKAKGFQD